MKYIGTVLNGSINDLTVKISVSPTELREGAFVVIEDCLTGTDYYGTLASISSSSLMDLDLSHYKKPLADLILGQTIKSECKVLLQQQAADVSTIKVQTRPSYGSKVRMAKQEDIRKIFGDKNEAGYFWIGGTREENHPVCINLDNFIQRSFAIFGATGTGKSYLLRMILAGLIKYDQSSVLMYDMHGEYAFDDVNPETKARVTGLKAVFPDKVLVASVGANTKVRGHDADMNITIPMSDIYPSDILALAEKLNLKETSQYILEALYKSYGDRWLETFMSMSPKDVKETVTDEEGNKTKKHSEFSIAKWAEDNGVFASSVKALYARLKNLVYDKSYIVANKTDSIGNIVDALKSGKNVFLSFEKFETELDYLIVSNAITRRINEEWVKDTNEFRNDPFNKEAPRHLTIFIEEAHKLLSESMASQTCFGKIASEFRKYNVTLGIVDQRPSYLASSVMSQIGTRIMCVLNDSDDIKQALCGLANKDELKTVLAGLEQKQEALIAGYGVPIPMCIHTRRYDETFWKEEKPQLQNAADNPAEKGVVQKKKAGKGRIVLNKAEAEVQQPQEPVSVPAEQDTPLTIESMLVEEPAAEVSPVPEAKSEPDKENLQDLNSKLLEGLMF